VLCWLLLLLLLLLLQQRDHDEFVVRLKDLVADKQQLLQDLRDNAAAHFDLQVRTCLPHSCADCASAALARYSIERSSKYGLGSAVRFLQPPALAVVLSSESRSWELGPIDLSTALQ
jgi:hypothetical protein